MNIGVLLVNKLPAVTGPYRVRDTWGTCPRRNKERAQNRLLNCLFLGGESIRPNLEGQIIKNWKAEF